MQSGEADGDDLAGLLGDYKEALESDFDKLAALAISGAMQETARESDYLIYTQEYDQMEYFDPVNHSPDSIKEMEEDVAALAGPTSKEMERVIKARSLSRWKQGMNRGRLNSRALSKLAVGARHPEIADDRIFKQREMHQSNDVAVQLVVDCSGSMNNGKIYTACATAYLLSDVLGRLKIPNEIIGFTTCFLPEHEVKKVLEQEKETGLKYARLEALDMPIFKRFEDRFDSKVKARLAEYPRGRRGVRNIDGECLEKLAVRLSQRQESGKLMIVLSDGNPNAGMSYDDRSNGIDRKGMANMHTKRVVKQIEDSEINIVGIGIQTDAVSQFYRHHVRLDNVQDLPKTVLKELKQVIMSAIH